MPRTTATIPEELTNLIDGAIEAGAFENRSDAIRHVLREYFERNEPTRVAAAIAAYEMENVSLGGAAQMAGVNRFEMREILREEGVELRLGPKNMEEAMEEIEAASDLE